MFKEDMNVFFTDFAEIVNYSNGSYANKLKAIIDHDVKLIGSEGQIANVVTTFTLESNTEIVIGGMFNNFNGSYDVDSIISDDKILMVVSVVKK